VSSALTRVGRFAATHALLVLVAWLIFAVALVAIANSVGRPENDDVTLPGTGSQSATDLLDKQLPQQANGSVPIVLQSNASLAEGQNKQAVEDTAKSLAKNQYVQQVISPFSEQGQNNITKDGQDRLHRRGSESLLRRTRRRRGKQRLQLGRPRPKSGDQGLRGGATWVSSSPAPAPASARSSASSAP